MIKMPHKWRKARGDYFKRQITQAMVDRSALIKKRKDIRALYFKEPGGFDSAEPWEGASDIHLPIILDKIETAVPKTVSSMWRADPFVNVGSPSGAADESSAKNVENFLSWAFKNDIPDFYLTLSNQHRNAFLDGTSFMKIIWDRSMRKTIEVHTVPAVMKVGDVEITGEEVKTPRKRTIEEALRDVFGYGDPNNTFYSVKPKGKNKYLVNFTEDGEKFDCTVEIEEGKRIDEMVVKVKRLIIEHDNPDISCVDFEDIVFPFRSQSIQKAKWVAHKTWYSIQDVRRKRESKEWIFTDEEFETVINSKRANDPDNEVAKQKDTVIGGSVNTGTEASTDDGGYDPNAIQIWEIYTKDFVDDDEDYPMDIVLFVPDVIGVVVGLQYHDELFPHCRRPFVCDTYIPVDGRIYGIGMAELLYGINLSADKTINQINNAMEVKGNPWFMYSAFGLAASAKLLSGIRPGEGIPVGDVNSIKFPDFSQQPLDMFHAGFETLRGYADSLTFSPSVAGNNNYRNAPRTARGTLALMDAAEEKLSSIVEKSQATAWKEMVKQVAALYAAYIGIDKWYRVTGETQARRISPRELRNDWQFDYTGSLTSVNREVQQALAERRYMALRADPLYQQDPQAHIALIENYAKHMTTGEDYKNMVPALPGTGNFSHAPMDQDTELKLMIYGHDVEVLPVDDHVGHIAKIEKFIKSDAFETIPQWAVAYIHRHMRDHESAMQSAQTMQATSQMQPNMQGAPQPGMPVEGMAAMGGELSTLQGGPM